MAFISAAVWGAGRVGLDINSETLAGIVAPLWLYVTGQAFVDFGKSKALIEAEVVVAPSE